MKKVLIIQLSRMGDLILTLPLVAALKEEDKDCEVTLTAYKEFSGVIAELPLIDRLIRLEREHLDQLPSYTETPADGGNPFPELQDEYDTVINLAFMPQAAELCGKVKAKKRYGRVPSNKDEVRLLGKWLKYLFSYIHHRNHNLFGLADLFTRSGGVSNRVVSGYLEVTPEQEARVRELFKDSGYDGQERLVAIQLGASESIRAWELEKFVTLARRLAGHEGIKPVLIGSPAEAPLAERFAREADFPFINLVGKTDLPLLPAVLRACDFLIGNDSGPVHIAAAVGTRVLSICFASAYFAETGPYGTGNIVVHAETDCSPCREDTPCDAPKCRDLLTAEGVGDVAEFLLLGREIQLDAPGFFVYESGFLENGTLVFRPVLGKRISHWYQRGLLNRMMWEEAAELPAYFKFVDAHFDAAADFPVWRRLIPRYIEELKQLDMIFKGGVKACRALLGEFGKGPVSNEVLNKSVQALNVIEQFIDRREGPMAVLKTFFNYEIMDMDYLQFPALAEELKRKYMTLIRMVKAFRTNIEAIAAHYDIGIVK